MLTRRGDRDTVVTMRLLVAALLAAAVGIVLIESNIGWAGVSNSPEPFPPTDTTSAARTGPDPSRTVTRSPKPSESPSASKPAPPSRDTPSRDRPKDRTTEQPAGVGDPMSGRYQAPPAAPQATRASPLPEQAALPQRSAIADHNGGQAPSDASYLSEAVSRGLIVGGAAGFVVSVVGMILVGWLRRRV